MQKKEEEHAARLEAGLEENASFNYDNILRKH